MSDPVHNPSPAIAPEPPRRCSPMMLTAICWIAGVAIGVLTGRGLWWWTGIGIAALITGALCLSARRRHVAGLAALIATLALGCAWCIVRTRQVAPDDIRQYLADDPVLARVTGVINSPPHLASRQRGALGRFNYRPPSTLAYLDLETIDTHDSRVPASGTLLLRLENSDHRLRHGARIEATGWLAAIDPPSNPGEFDYRQMLAQRGVHARLALHNRDNWRPLEPPRTSPGHWLDAGTQRLASAAHSSLHLGMRDQPTRMALIDALLLGRWSADLAQLSDAFRRTGLTHLLSISGAHLSILLAVVWLVARLFVRHPRHAAIVVAVTVILYLSIIPPQVPLIRSGIMALAFCIAAGSGRMFTGADALALSAILVFLWRPQDIANPGCQLSFLGVAALLMLTRPLSQWLHNEPVTNVATGNTSGGSGGTGGTGGAGVPTAKGPSKLDRFRRHGADFLAANLAAAFALLPLVAFHFSIISPLAAALSMLILPVVSLTIALGFAKIIIGIVFPTLGIALARPLEWSSDLLIGMVDHGSRWPGACIELARPPSIAWTVAATVVIVALFSGAFGRRWRTLAGIMFVLIAWLVLPQLAPSLPSPTDADPPRITVNFLSVGDGSCAIIRPANRQPWGDGRAIMFDCGSMQYTDVGVRSVVPALRHLGVSRLEAIFISHADLDHFCGVLDVLDHVTTDRVVMTPQTLADARQRPDAAIAALIAGIKARGVPITNASRGWKHEMPEASLELLWPPAGLVTPRNNDSSMVLSIKSGNARVLMNGDIQQLAIQSLLVAGVDLHADATDLPHHGSFVEASPRWIAAVSPRVVIQSSGKARLRDDRWVGRLPTDVTRLITARQGMIELVVTQGGNLRWSTMRSDDP